MRDVASVVFSNMYAVQARMSAIQSKLKAFNAPVEAPTQNVPAATKPTHRTAGAAGVQPFFPKELALALRPTADAPKPAKSDYEEMIAEAASKNGVDPDLVKAVVKAESGFRRDAVSACGARGLMQLMPSTAAALRVSDPFDPAQNIEAGTRYLKSQIDRFGSTELALAAYNAGPGNVVKYGGIPPFRETRNYVSRVMGYLGDNQNGR